MRRKVAEINMFVKHIDLFLNDDLCCLCGMCVDACPKEAIKIMPGNKAKGSAVLTRIEVDDKKCVLCGICDVICPFNAFELEIDGARKIPIIELKGYPELIKKVDHEPSKCKLCGKCVEACPRGAIKIEDGKHKIDLRLCITCPWCEDACPNNALKVRKVIDGSINIDSDKCPSDCSICVSICPAKTIHESKTKEAVAGAKRITVDDRYCMYCGACVTVCPVQKDVKPIEFCRTTISHTPVRSMAWNIALDKLTSMGKTKELRVSGTTKARDVAKDLMGRKRGENFG